MNRRRFLLGLGTAAAVIAAPELLLPKRTFLLPPPGGWASGKGDGQLFYEWMLEQQEPLTVTLSWAAPPLPLAAGDIVQISGKPFHVLESASLFTATFGALAYG